MIETEQTRVAEEGQTIVAERMGVQKRDQTRHAYEEGLTYFSGSLRHFQTNVDVQKLARYVDELYYRFHNQI